MTVLRRTHGGLCAPPERRRACIFVGLGCEANQITSLFGAEQLRDGDRARAATTSRTSAAPRRRSSAASALVREMLPAANRVERDDVPASHLMLGLQCGGSDGYSGITANPALGDAVDLLVAHGGTAILSETPEIYGAEHLLTRRAVSREVGEKLIARIKWWEDYTARNQRRDEQQPVARQQGGRPHDDPREVARRGRQGRHDEPHRRLRVRAAGRQRRASSSWTRRATTRCRPPGQVAGGANMICFTTGRGSVYGCAPSPSLKLVDQHASSASAGRRHGPELRRRSLDGSAIDRGRRGSGSST